MKITNRVAGLATILAAGLLAGCTQEARQQYGNAGSTATEAVQETGQAIKADAMATKKMLAKDSKRAEKSIRDESARAEVMASSDETSARVKGALVAAKNLHTGDLHVNTNAHTVTLTGSVPTADEKHRAAVITKQQLGTGYTVVNKLSVS